MFICTDFAGMTLKEADDLRRAVGKKKKELMAKMKDKFIQSAVRNGENEKMAEHIFEWIGKFANYGFNKCVIGSTKLIRPSNNQFGDNKFEIGHLYKLANDLEYAKKHNQKSLRSKLRMSGYGKCLALDSDGRVRPRTIKTIHYNGPKDVVKVTDSDGRTITCTKDHKFMTPNGEMVPIEKIGVGGQVLCHLEQYDNEYIYNYNMHQSVERSRKESLVDTIGRHNGGFIDGNWSAFESIKKQFDNIDNCEICGYQTSRLEWHHIDQNRSNNIRENLLKLCASCHKKEDYAAGRRRRWEKGHKTTVATIVSIEPAGIEDTYDVEMDTDEHNWIGDGFIISNSHGVGYAYTAYRTAYAKCHFPLEFFKAMLTNSEGKQDELEEIKQLVNEAKLWNIKVKTPQLALLNKDFIMKDGSIIFGLLHIKGVGATAFAGLKKISSVKDYKELLKKVFIEEVKVDARTMEALIKSGALDYLYEGGRIGLLKLYRFLKALTEREVKYVFEKVDGGINFGQAISELLKSDIPNKSRKPRIEANIAEIKAEFATANEKKLCIAYEKYHLGMALSGSETELFSNPKVNMTCRSFLKIPDKTKCTLGIVVDKIKHNTDKNGGHMAFLEGSDHTYMIDGIVVFASKYEQFKRFLEEEGRPLAITGRKDGESLLVDKIEDL